jgi:ribonuclease-3
MIIKRNLEEFETEINFKFKDKKNLHKALIHPSFVKEKNFKKNILSNNFERLEFLGDRVLGICIAYLIYNKFKDLNEGDLTKKFSYLVQKEFLYKIAIEIKIDKVLKYSYKKDNPRSNRSVLADSVESLIGSIFIDSGYRASLKFIKYIWGPYLNIKASNDQDPKTKLQEISQHLHKSLPEYCLKKKEGPSHSPIFTISLKVLNLKNINASGNSIREAEKNAAKIALKLINEK